MDDSGLQLLTSIILGDVTTLKWRGLAAGIFASPYIVNAFVGANVATGVLEHSTWRWGCESYLLVVEYLHTHAFVRRHVRVYGTCVYLTPRHHSRMGGAQSEDDGSDPTKRKIELRGALVGFLPTVEHIWPRAVRYGHRVDFAPLNSQQNRKGWLEQPYAPAPFAMHPPLTIILASIIAMIVVGCVVLCMFIVWDGYFARYPVCPRRFLTNRAFQAAIWISFFDFVSFGLNQLSSPYSRPIVRSLFTSQTSTSTRSSMS